MMTNIVELGFNLCGCDRKESTMVFLSFIMCCCGSGEECGGDTLQVLACHTQPAVQCQLIFAL